MLETLLRHIHNRFEYAYDDGRFAIADRTMVIDGLQEGQYFWVEGSVFNDGLHRYPDADMHDEEFTGRVVFLAIPPAFLELADSIGEWCGKHSSELDSPYQSESFGGYSYSKETASDGAQGWAAKFGGELSKYRKLGHSGW